MKKKFLGIFESEDVLKPDEMICGNCFYFAIQEMDESKYAPCTVNPPQMQIPQGSTAWVSSRPFAHFGHPMCKEAMVHPERKFKKEDHK